TASVLPHISQPPRRSLDTSSLWRTARGTNSRSVRAWTPVGEDRVLLPPKRNTTEPRNQRLLTLAALHADLEAPGRFLPSRVGMEPDADVTPPAGIVERPAQPSVRRAMPCEWIQGDEWGAYVTLGRTTRTNAGSPTGCEPQGDGVPVVVVGVTTHQGGRESRS